MNTNDITKTRLYSDILTYRKLRESYDSETESMRNILRPSIDMLEARIVADREKLSAADQVALNKALVTNIYGTEDIDVAKINKDYQEHSAAAKETSENETLSDYYKDVTVNHNAIVNKEVYNDLFDKIIEYRTFNEAYQNDTDYVKNLLQPIMEEREAAINEAKAKLTQAELAMLEKDVFNFIHGKEDTIDSPKTNTNTETINNVNDKDYTVTEAKENIINNNVSNEEETTEDTPVTSKKETTEDTPVTSKKETTEDTPVTSKKETKGIEDADFEEKLNTWIDELNKEDKIKDNTTAKTVAAAATGTAAGVAADKFVTDAEAADDKKVAEDLAKKVNDKVNDASARTIDIPEEDVENIKENAKKEAEEPVVDANYKVVAAPKKAKKHIWKKILLALATIGSAIAIIFGVSSCHKNSKEGIITNNSITASTTDTNSKNTTSVADTSSNSTTKSDVDYSKMSFQELLNATTDTTKHNTVLTISNYFDYFNGDFANHYTKAGVQDKFALSWNEIVAQYLRLNDLSNEEVEKLFDTYKFDDNDFMNYYKTGVLQLIGAFCAETRDMPVKLDSLINDEAGKTLYNKYNDNMIAMNEALAKGDTAEATRLDAEFYNMIVADFPELADDNTYGAVHNNRSLSANYYSQANIFVAAHRTVARNLNTNLWTDDFIAKFNDLGICNEVNNIYQNIEEDLTCYLRSLKCCGEEATMSPYIYLMQAKDMGINLDLRDWTLFVTIDANEFNKTCTESGYGNTVAQGYTGCTTTEETEQHSETSTTYTTSDSSYTTNDRSQAVAAAGEDAVKQAEAKVDESIAADNAKAKADAEAAAEKARQEAQAKADAETAQKQKEVDSDNAKTESEISNITDGNDSTSSNITIDPDDKGDISNATTDSTGAVDDNTPLPDPNSTGAEFDNEATNSTSTTNETNQNITESEEPVLGSSQTNEEKAEEIVNQMVNSTNSVSEETNKVLTK